MSTPEVTINDDGSVTLSGGQVIRGSHVPGTCLGEHCPLHNPSEHAYRDLPLYFNGKHMYRSKGNLFYVDPDDYEFSRSHYAIIRNSAKCLACGDEVVSRNRHDYTSCSCGAIFVDGGNEYIRSGGDPEKFMSTAVVIDERL